MRIALVYEITNNPYFSPTNVQYDDRLSEFIQPGEINKLVRTFKMLGHQTDVIDGPLGLISGIESLKETRSMVFNKSVGFKGLERKIHVPSICSLYDIPFVGSSAYGMTLARHKYHTNKLLNGMGIRVPESRIIYPGHSVEEHSLRFPVLVKPNFESDSLGISDASVFQNQKGLLPSIKKLHDDFQQPVVIEEYVSGEEWKVPVIGNTDCSKSVGCVGVLKNGQRLTNTLQTREDVIKDELEYYHPHDKKKVRQAKAVAKLIHDQFELRDYSRTDFRISQKNELVCMEVSTHPDLNENSSFVKGAIQSFSSFEEVMSAILNASMKRYDLSHLREQLKME